MPPILRPDDIDRDPSQPYDPPPVTPTKSTSENWPSEYTVPVVAVSMFILFVLIVIFFHNMLPKNRYTGVIAFAFIGLFSSFSPLYGRLYRYVRSMSPNSREDRRLRETRDHEIRVIEAHQRETEILERLEKLKLDHEDRKLKITQPHQVRMEQEQTLKEMLILQRQLAVKADKTDIEQELDTVVAAAVTQYRSLASIPPIYDAHGNVDDVAMNRMYQGITDHGWQLLNTTVAKSKKDLAG